MDVPADHPANPDAPAGELTGPSDVLTEAPAAPDAEPSDGPAGDEGHDGHHGHHGHGG